MRPLPIDHLERRHIRRVFTSGPERAEPIRLIFDVPAGNDDDRINAMPKYVASTTLAAPLP